MMGVTAVSLPSSLKTPPPAPLASVGRDTAATPIFICLLE